MLVAATSSACASESGVEAKLRQTYSKLVFESVTESPIKGVYEVTAGGNVFYFDPVSAHVVFGEMWSPQGVSVTGQARTKIQGAKYENIKKHLGDAVKIGNGPNEVIEISDPDCPYCRKMDEYWSKRTDVTRYIFFMPLTQLHPNAKAHVEYIISSADPAKALDEVRAGTYDATAVPSLAVKAEKVKAQAEVVAGAGLSGTPAFYVNGVFIGGANVPAIEKALKPNG